MKLDTLRRMDQLTGVFVAGTPIAEHAIAREMQHHPARDADASRTAAARALVVRELLRREIERLDLGAAATPHGRETAEEAAIRVLLEREVDGTRPGDTECRRYYAQNRDRLHAPDRMRARHILLAAAPDDAEARLTARKAAEAMLAELRAHPERFADFALRHSACPSRDQGGELGWLTRGATTPEFDRQLFALAVGLAAQPLESRYGVHVVCVDAIERGTPLDYDTAAPLIAQYLEQQQQQNAVHQYLQLLFERYAVSGLDGIGGARAA